VQEALTNVLKHAGPTQTTIGLHYAPTEVTLRVTNQPPPEPPLTPPDRAGHGLIGMRERVAMAGGDLQAGPTPDGGFEVRARLPVEARRPAPRQAQLAAGRP